MQRAIILVFVMICSISAFSQTKGRKYSNEFLAIGVSAKGQGMGNAQVASVNDVTSSFFNPAGLLGIKDNLQFSYMHSEWFTGIGKYDYIGAAGPFNSKVEGDDVKRALGGTLIRFGIDNIPNTLSLYEDDGTINYDNISSFSAADYALILSYAQGVNDKLDIGANFKIIHHKVGLFGSAWGFGLDLGAKYRVNQEFTLGLTIKDLTSTFNAWSFNFTDQEKKVLLATGNELPESSVEITKPRIIFGAAYSKRFPLGNKKVGNNTSRFNNSFGITGEIDLDITTDGKRNVLISSNPISINPMVGLEMDYAELIFLRGGMSNFQQSSTLEGKEFWAIQPSAGLGVKLWNVRLDYTFSNLGDQQQKLYSHVVSLLINIDFKFFSEQIKNAG